MQDIVNGMRVLINQFSGVWADDNYGTSTTLRIQSKAPSWTFPGLAVHGWQGEARRVRARNRSRSRQASNDALLFTVRRRGRAPR